jgi:hypothetical protein
MRPYDDDEVDEVLEDGELPSLTLKPAKGRMVNGRRTTRPLSPPSKAGATSTLEQGPAETTTHNSGANWMRIRKKRTTIMKRSPDDEMAARQVTRRNDRVMPFAKVMKDGATRMLC